MRINPSWSVHNALVKIESTFKKYDPASPFKASFADDEFAKKFGNEKRIGTLATVFAILAIFISCLGLFGLASFVAEQRVKEIGIRKVLGASVSNIWQLLSKEFVMLVMISCALAIPIAYFFMRNWLQKYDYRTSVSWQVCAVAALGAVVITVLTVSFQAIKAAVSNPVKSLRSE
jgi:ABC-type antimicrobial peptide transport system permease subunit